MDPMDQIRAVRMIETKAFSFTTILEYGCRLGKSPESQSTWRLKRTTLVR